MCGIVGRAGRLKTDDERIFKTLLLLDYFRGQDSTGVAIVSKSKKVDVIKVADDPIMLFQQVDYDSLVVGTSDAIWLGHNRAATVGSTTRANAHPFKCNHITGVHNGTLEKSSFFELGMRLEREYGTDSETVYQHIAEYGIDETVKRMQGAWALVWFDEKAQTLNMLRNDKRPLYICRTTRDGTQFLTWASEYKMIVAARAMADVPDGKLIANEEGYGFFPLDTDVLHSWTLEQILAGELTPETRPLKGMDPPPPPPVTKITYNTPPFTGTSTCSTGAEVKKPPFSVVPDVYEVTDLELEDDGLILGCFDKQEWDELTRFGCACCGSDVTPEQKGLIIYTNEGTVLCPNCSDEETTIVSNSFSVKMNDRIIG